MSERELQLVKMYRRLKFVLAILQEANKTLQAQNHQKDAQSMDDTNQFPMQDDVNEGEHNHG